MLNRWSGCDRIATMQAVVLFLNHNDEDPTKRRKLAGVRRYAAAARWYVVAVDRVHSRRRSIPALVARLRPVGCIYDCDGAAENVPIAHFGNVPVVFANTKDSKLDGVAGRVCVDDANVAATAFRELSAGLPPAYAVVSLHWPSALLAGRVAKFRDFAAWSDIRIEAFRRSVIKAGRECTVFRARRGESRNGEMERLRPFLSSLPPKTAIYAINDETAFVIAATARAAMRFIPHDLTLIGTDNDTALCEAAQPSLSSIQLDFERMGYLAAKMLAGRISHGGAKSPLSIGPLLCVRRASTRGHGRRAPYILDAVETIRSEACEGLTPRELISRFKCSRSLFNLRFREAMGHSVLEEILQVRLERVVELLKDHAMPIGAIADFSGFGTHRDLDKLFRKRFGCSLRDWRRLNARP